MDENLRNVRVLVKNLNSGSVSYNLEARHIRREWMKEGQILPIPADELQEALYDQGIYNLFHLGYLGVDNPDHRILVGLEYKDYGEKMIPFDRKRALDLLSDKCSAADFETKLYNIRTKSGEIDTLISAAYALKNVDYNKQKLIKEILGVDVTALIRNNEE